VAEELIAFASKGEMLAKSKQFWNPDKTQFWIDSGVPLVIDRREGYFIYDVEGKRLIDVHLNGGTYNLGHRNPEVTAARWTPAPRPARCGPATGSGGCRCRTAAWPR
jgi:4-aminobutyrate aminotransferase-like enzyme